MQCQCAWLCTILGCIFKDLNCSGLQLLSKETSGPSIKGHVTRGKQCGAAGPQGTLCWYLSSNVTTGEERTPGPCHSAQKFANIQSKAGKGTFLALSESKVPSSLVSCQPGPSTVCLCPSPRARPLMGTAVPFQTMNGSVKCEMP